MQGVKVYEVVLKELRRRIEDGELRPGAQIPSVRDLAVELGVGQSSVREAIRVLANMGILHVRHGLGTFVAADPLLESMPRARFSTLEQQNVVALTEVRRVVEPHLAQLAALRATPDEIAAIVGSAQQMAALVTAGEDFLEPDLEFHMLIARAAHNKIFEQVMQTVQVMLLDSRRVTSQIPGMPEQAASYHLSIAAAIRAREGARAHQLMEAHMDSVIDTLSNVQIYGSMREALVSLKIEPRQASSLATDAQE